MRCNVLALEIELPPKHDPFPMVYHLGFEVLPKKIDLLYLFIFLDFLSEFTYCIELVLVLIIVGDAA